MEGGDGVGPYWCLSTLDTYAKTNMVKFKF